MLYSLNIFALNIRPEDFYQYDFGEQPGLIEVLLHLGISIIFALLMWGSVSIQEKVKNRTISACATAMAFVGMIGAGYNFLPCLATYWFWIIALFIALVVGVFAFIFVSISKKTHSTKRTQSYSLNKGDYIFVGRVDSKTFRESGAPKSTYKSIGKATSDYIYKKDGIYYFDMRGQFLQVEDNPHYGDLSVGEWGTYKYRYKIIYNTTKYCPQGWGYYYFNF